MLLIGFTDFIKCRIINFYTFISLEVEYGYFICRTLQTAVGVFGGEGYTDRMDVVPLMAANAGNSGRAAISSLNCPPIIAVELCREHLVSLISVFH